MSPKTLLLLCIPLLVCAPLGGEANSSKTRTSLFSNQTRLLDERARQKENRAISFRAARVHAPAEGLGQGAYVSAARAAAVRHQIPEWLFLRLVRQESNWRADARSHKGAIGLTQLMPQTARELGVNPHDPLENLEGGARYLREQYLTFGSWRLALAAYNAGPGAVRKHGGIPPYAETRAYVRKILDLPS
jgi:soluble lytic murein transglycosylase-like protein